MENENNAKQIIDRKKLIRRILIICLIAIIVIAVIIIVANKHSVSMEDKYNRAIDKYTNVYLNGNYDKLFCLAPSKYWFYSGEKLNKTLDNEIINLQQTAKIKANNDKITHEFNIIDVSDYDTYMFREILIYTIGINRYDIGAIEKVSFTASANNNHVTKECWCVEINNIFYFFENDGQYIKF